MLNLGISNLFLLNMEMYSFCESFIELRVEPHSNESPAIFSQIPLHFDYKRIYLKYLTLKMKERDFPGAPVVKNLPAM